MVDGERLSARAIDAKIDPPPNRGISLRAPQGSMPAEPWCAQVGECRQSAPDVERSTKTRGQTCVRLNSATLPAATDPTSLISAGPCKTSAFGISSSTLQLSKKTKVLRPPVESTLEELTFSRDAENVGIEPKADKTVGPLGASKCGFRAPYFC